MKPLGQTARLWAVLKDGRPHSMPELHRQVGVGIRLNSRVAEARKRFNARIDCWYSREARTWFYQYRPAGEVTEPGASSQPADGAGPPPPGSATATADLLEVHGAAVSAPMVVASLLGHVDEAYAERVAERLREEDSRRRLRRVK